MTEDENEYLCERRLLSLNGELHTCYRNSVFAMDRLLTNYKMIFPFFTNHTFEHSAQVIRYCNLLAGADNVAKLNAEELYILLMGAALHDMGMGISKGDFEECRQEIAGLEAYTREHPAATVGEYARAFHQEFSGWLIRKYKDLFEIPGEGYVYGICQVARGHRNMDLTDPGEFSDYTLENGARVRLSYLAALVKLADELDIAADRNLLFDYSLKKEEWSPKQTMCYQCHKAIRQLSARGDEIVLTFSTDDPAVQAEIMNIEKKVQKTFSEYVRAVGAQPDFHLCRNRVRFCRVDL